MIIQNQTYVAKVETKQKAKKIYRESKNNAGLLESKVEFEETHHVSVGNKPLLILPTLFEKSGK